MNLSTKRVSQYSWSYGQVAGDRVFLDCSISPNEELTEPFEAMQLPLKDTERWYVKKPRAVTYKVCTAKLERGYPVNVEAGRFWFLQSGFKKKSETYKWTISKHSQSNGR